MDELEARQGKLRLASLGLLGAICLLVGHTAIVLAYVWAKAQIREVHLYYFSDEGNSIARFIEQYVLLTYRYVTEYSATFGFSPSAHLLSLADIILAFVVLSRIKKFLERRENLIA